MEEKKKAVMQKENLEGHKKSMFEGFPIIFSFTFKQAVKQKTYLLVTFLTALGLLGGMIALNLLLAKDDIREEQVKGKNEILIEKLFLKNDTEIASPNTENLAEADKKYDKLEIEEFTGEIKETLKKISTDLEDSEAEYADESDREGSGGAGILDLPESGKVLAVHFYEKDKKLYLDMYMPEGTAVKQEDAEDLLDVLEMQFQTGKILSSGLETQVIALATAPVTTTVTKAGEEDEDIMETFLKMLLPMIVSLLMYMMILTHGQSISKAVVSEKTSKLMDTLLLSVQPYALIAGKIAAMIVAALIQIIIWMIGVVVGWLAGDVIVKFMAPDAPNVVLDMIELFQSHDTGAAFSIPALILGFLALVLGFSMFCVIAGLVSAKVSKPDDISQAMSMFQVIIVLSFFASYFIPIVQNDTGKLLATVFRYIPFTAAFMLPPDLLLGNIGLTGGIVSLLILCICLVACIILTGKIYRNAVFYKGSVGKLFSRKSLQKAE